MNIHVPALPSAAALRTILAHRMAVALGQQQAPLEAAMTPAAVTQLYQVYLANGTGSLRQTLLVAHSALTHACDDESGHLDVAHINLAATE